jgi:hypothetical protein
MNVSNRPIASALCALALFVTPLAAHADPPDKPSPAEMPFVTSVAADLNARFPTPADAVRAGYLRYGDEDDTGAISYANRVWTSVDERHPSQLWYDAKGRLIGADFSVPYGPAQPHLFGVDPRRWSRFRLHEHYGLVGPNGTTVYGATSAKKVVAAGGDAAHPTAENLVAIGIAKNASDVRFVFAFPDIWDLSVWTLPNPNGAFADKNPDVVPVHPPKPGMDM